MKYLKYAIIIFVVVFSILFIIDKVNVAKEADFKENNSEEIEKTNTDDYEEETEEVITDENNKKKTNQTNEKYVNSPNVSSNGLIPIIYDEKGNAIEKFNQSTEWYNYDKTKRMWANAITKDNEGNITGYYVWIPRFAYKITYNNLEKKEEGGEIDVKFLIGKSDEYIDSDGKRKKAVHSLEQDGNSQNDYVVHPAFIDDSKNDYKNNGWDKELEGFWIAKYPATYQQVSMNDKELTDEKRQKIVYSNYKYASTQNAYKKEANYLGKITEDTLISYPTFMPLSFTYTDISIGDAITIANDISKKQEMYNLKNIDSHIMRISEWGAVNYLTKSDYGGKGETYQVNNYYSLVQMYDSYITNLATGLSEIPHNEIEFMCDNIDDMNLYYTKEGMETSSTGNIYGIYDMFGGANEYLSSYINNGHRLIEKYGNSNGQYNYFGKTGNTKYITMYPFDEEKRNDKK